MTEGGLLPRVWLLLVYGSDRTYSGNEGYQDLDSTYRYDSLVANHKQIHAGAICFLSDRSQLLGLAVVKGVESEAGTKTLRRCPECRRTNLHSRKTMYPPLRCQKCGATFEEPIEEVIDCEKFEADFGETPLAPAKPIGIGVLREACFHLADQQSMREMDPDRARSLLKDDAQLSRAFDEAFQPVQSPERITTEGKTAIRSPGAEYSLDEHRHRFACWAAACAVRRGFASNARIKSAIDASSLREFVSSPTESWPENEQEVDEIHRKWAGELAKRLADDEVLAVTYGRLAKIIAVYLKTMLVLNSSINHPFTDLIHPPIDRMLLKAISEDRSFSKPAREMWRRCAWTMLDEEQYFSLLKSIRDAGPFPQFWTLERYWQPDGSNEDDF